MYDYYLQRSMELLFRCKIKKSLSILTYLLKIQLGYPIYLKEIDKVSNYLKEV